MGGYLSSLLSNKTKGFTLIELLAVIVVLAIIAIIAVPMIMNIIEKSRKGADVSSARNYIRASESYIVLSELDTNKISFKNNNRYNVTKETVIEEKIYPKINDLVDIKGNLPSGSEDYIVVDDNNKITESLLTINGYQIKIQNDEVISITKDKIIEVKSISINEEKVMIGINETLQLEATIEPDNATNKNITWTSSDERVAIVDSKGIVTGIKEGTVIITATTVNGKVATVNIIVSTINVKNEVDTNIEHGTNKDIVSTYFNVTDSEEATCKVGDTIVETTDDIAEKVGINDTYKVECSSATGSSSIDIKVANKLYLYKEGNEFINITGGWKGYSFENNKGLYEIRTSSMYIASTSETYGNATVITNNKIDLNQYKKLKIIATSTGLNVGRCFGLRVGHPTSNDEMNNFYKINCIDQNLVNQEWELELSEHDKYYVSPGIRMSYTTSRYGVSTLEIKKYG